MKKRLLILYYCTFVLAVVAATLGYFCVKNGWLVIEKGTAANMAIYGVIILYVICSTPLVLKFFGRFAAKIRKIEDEKLRQKRYTCLVATRLGLVALGLVASLFFYYILTENSLLWLAGISAIALYFCKPTADKVDQDLEPDDEPTDTQVADNQG